LDLTQSFDPNQPYAHYDELRLLQTTDRVMLRQRPGRRFEYSNYGYALLGIALERTEDRSLEDLLKEYITGPLGMSDTTIALGPDQRTRLVAPHTATGQQTAPWGGSAMGAFEAAGAMHASIGDMAAWADFQRQVLADPGRVREKHSELASLVTAVESSHSSIRALPVGSAATTSGWFVRRFTKGGPAYLYHDGITGGFTAHMAVSVDGSHAFVMLANQAPSDAQTDMFLRELQATHTAAKR
jgi:CubicO group peptidase (beta-lactamase class C family)